MGVPSSSTTPPDVLSAWRDRAVLVFGGSGFLGRHLGRALSALGARTRLLGSADGDLTAGPLDLQGTAYDAMFFLASFQGGGTYAATRQADISRLNLAMVQNALETWRRQSPAAHFISVGSSCAYPSLPRPMHEDEYWDGPLHDSVRGYGLAKRTLQALQQMYREQYGLRASHFILSTLFGEGDRYDAERAHVVAGLIGRFVAARRAGAPRVEVWGDGSAVREFLYVGDQVTRLLLAAERAPADLLNIGAGQGTSIRTLATAVKRATGYEGDLWFNEARFVGTPFKVLSTARADAALPPFPFRPLDEALAATVAAYERDHPDA